ncbi:helix-turn-helix transcriptional regulator [Paraburkholderia unamae]|uniref:helix-turn-helix transcriptional regulator n=1 Tax=Paraburkholderia unamae TaxID=219649 RepID=UPI001CB564AC|nr:helix-turn-helix domain-containing protein [Paraburkholderia unamae]CAG9269815.1 HTH-type transcriptional regulator / antitoxin HipB [Paraburkholderia unamae]
MDYPVKTLSQLRPILVGFRKKAGLTQEALARRLGISQQSYAAFEANPESASVERLFRVLRLVDVEMKFAAPQAQAAPVVAAKISSAAAPAAAKPRRRATPAATPAAPSSATQTARPPRKTTARSKSREDW